jgi:hypothetical protein
MHPGRVGANRREAFRRVYQLPVPIDQLEHHTLPDLVCKGIWFCDDQATPYLIDP